MAVLGIVAAMAIPALLTTTNKAEYKVAWKKAYAELSQATQKMAYDAGGSLDYYFQGPFSQHDDFKNKYLSYLNTTKTCDVGTSGCWHEDSDWYYLSGITQLFTTDYTFYSRLVLSNGQLVFFVNRGTACNGTHAANDNGCGWILVDINGVKKPNKIGKDIYLLVVLKNGSVAPAGTSGDFWDINTASHSCDVETYTTTSGLACSAKYLME